MLERDQAVRTSPDVPTEEWDRVDSANAARMRQILDEHGWPGWSLVGKDGSTAAWALVQHADLQPDLQRRGLELLQKAVDDGDASPGDLAYLVDRVRVAENKPQVYGTQWEPREGGEWKPRTPIEDEAGVDERRRKAGLKPLQEYLRELKSLPGQG
ncbi:hypothetical protein HS041_07100 [Planomonospora sp. ID67723]|nr:hypothetical protein [Planomonospora sp. ID67723]